MKKRVTGMGGIFFKSQEPEKMKDWYNKHLGLEAGEYGHTFAWKETGKPDGPDATTTWSPFKQDSTYFEPSRHDYMFNYRVENLAGLLEELRKEGVQIAGEMEEFEYGKFAWILDPEGRKIELWEPVDGVF